MPKELRPSEVIELYWREVISIEEDADILEPIYLEVL